ncbi:hypothetical protein H4R34_004341 [Dimargaris verticillata]|uniref:COPI associated protein n=1 Tax=Dimargaris verticillata TaxID=2761393 RepID=A0A9W8ECB4_9FUNG|nr:hypothetical protein H4R34_004341 [Dimargaris verticillata]
MANAGYVANDVGLSWIFRVLNLVVAGLAASVGILFVITGDFQPLVIGIFCLLFTVLLLAMEISRPWPLVSKCEFMFMFIGRGLFYVFLGCIMLTPKLFHLIAGGIVVGIGVLFCIMHFTSFELYTRDRYAPPPVQPTVRYPAMDSRYNLPAAYV